MIIAPHIRGNALLLDLTIVNPCVFSNLENATPQTGKRLTDTNEGKKNTCLGLVPATYSLFSLAVSTSGDLGQNMLALI